MGGRGSGRRPDPVKMFTPQRANIAQQSGLQPFELPNLSAVKGDGEVAQDIKSKYVNVTGDTMTGALLLPDGSAAAPSLSFSSDTDTGMGRAAADQLSLIAGGVEGMRIVEADGKVKIGIGTATPNKELHIYKDASTSVGIRMENKDTTNGGVLIGFDNGEDMFLYNYGIRGINFGTRGLERMRIAHDGNVGIGTSTPQNTLNVLGDFNQTGGNSTIDMIYAEAWGKDIGDVIISDANVYYPITNLTQGLINGMSGNNENLTVIFDGVYKIVAHWSFSGTANNEYHISIDVNGVQQDKCHAERKIGTGGDVGSASFTCLYDFNIGDKVRMVIENADAGNDATIHSINTNMVRIGN